MDTYFAPAARAGAVELQEEIELVNSSREIAGQLQSVSGLLAVMNERRQIVGLNDAVMRFIGIDDAGQALGLRFGEAVKCIHADERPNGCGTTKHCASCGAAIATVVCLEKGVGVEESCRVTVRNNRGTSDVRLSVRSQPLNLDGRKFLSLTLRDIKLGENVFA